MLTLNSVRRFAAKTYSEIFYFIRFECLVCLKIDYISMSVFLLDAPRVVSIVLKSRRKALCNNVHNNDNHVFILITIICTVLMGIFLCNLDIFVV